MKYCNLNCKHIHASIIERCGEGIGYEYRCMAQKGMPKITTGTYCPYDELSETKQETNTEIKELKQELKAYKKAYEMVCNSLSDKTSCNWGYDEACKFCQEEGPEYRKTTSCVDNIKNFYLQKARGEE